jgi:hypothetical protein
MIDPIQDIRVTMPIHTGIPGGDPVYILLAVLIEQ